MRQLHLFSAVFMLLLHALVSSSLLQQPVFTNPDYFTFSGTGSPQSAEHPFGQVLAPFTVKGGYYKVSWEFGAGHDNHAQPYLLKAPDNELIWHPGAQRAPWSGEDFIHLEPGDYSIAVAADNYASWSVQVSRLIEEKDILRRPAP